MNKSTVLIVLIACSLSAFADKPNFVFILTDDMSWTGLSIAMDEREQESKSDFYQTPNIDRLAKQGMRFSRAYSPGPMCTPSRAAILTGKTPAELHITTPGGGGRTQSYHKLVSPQIVRDLPASETTIADTLRKQGYATAHLGKWHLGRGNPGQHGFDVHDGSTANEGPGTYEDPNPKDIFGMTKRASEFMAKQAKSGKPFYLQLSHYAVHAPLEALEVSKQKFQKLPAGERHSNVEFAAMTFDLDTSVGSLLKRIDELKLTENTYVVLMSDNGGPGTPRNSQNLPLAGGKGSLYEGGIRVPLIIRGPGIKPNTFCRENVTGCDLFPTFCEWAGLTIPGKLEGSSLVPLVKGKPEKFQRLENALLFHCPHYGQGPRQKPQSAIILGNYKILKDLETGAVRLFDLNADIGEKNDLSKEMPEKAEQMEALLMKRLKDVEAQMPTRNPNYDPDATSGRRRNRRN